MVEALAIRLANAIKRANPENTASIQVLKYGLIIVINFLTTVLTALLIGALLGRVDEVLIALAAFMILRAFSGGYHFKSSILCSLVTTIIVVIASMTTLPLMFSMVLNAVSGLLVLLFAPSRIERQSNIPRQFYPFLKMISLLIVASNFAVQSDLLTAIFFFQSVSLIYFNRERRGYQ